MRLRRASIIATLFLLASAATAYAECAWLLWEKKLAKNPISDIDVERQHWS